MSIYYDYHTVSTTPTYLALGSFDGLHMGHRAVIRQVTKQAGFVPAVLSVQPDSPTDQLIEDAQAQQILNQLGIERWIPVPLCDISHMSPTDFFETILLRRLQVRGLSCGFNFRFGHRAAGDTALLAELCRQHDVSLTVLPPVCYRGAPISSSRIRAALLAGDTAAAQAMLGRPFSFTASVERGRQLGHTLGFPTINQSLPGSMLCPRRGVYAVTVTDGQTTYGGVCNIGIHPTVGALPRPIAETHLFHCDEDLYGRSLTLSLCAFLRDEQTFAHTTALQQAITQDLARAKDILKGSI